MANACEKCHYFICRCNKQYKEQFEKQNGHCANCLQEGKKLRFDPQKLWLICEECFIIWYGRPKNGKDKSAERNEKRT